MSTTSQRLQLAVGDHLPHMRVGGARGHRPVHPAHVVAGLVDPRLPRLRSRARDQAEVVAVQHAVELARRTVSSSVRSAAASFGVTDLAARERRRVRRMRIARTACRLLADGWPRPPRRASPAAPNDLAAERR